MPHVRGERRPLSEIERIVATFISPSATFRDILRSESWWLPFVLLSLFSISLSYTIEHKIGFEQLTANQLHLNPSRAGQLDSMEPQARAAALSRAAVATRYISYAHPLLILLVGGFSAMILWATFNFGLGAQTTYQQMLSVWFYASLPRLLTVLVAVSTLWLGDTAETFNPRYPAGTSLGYYFSDAPGWLRVLLGFFDIVGIWTIVLLIIGTAIVARTSTGKAAAAIIGWWVLIVAVSVTATAAFT